MDKVTQVQILDKSVYILFSANTIGKGMNPIILPPGMGKLRADRALQLWYGCNIMAEGFRFIYLAFGFS